MSLQGVVEILGCADHTHKPCWLKVLEALKRTVEPAKSSNSYEQPTSHRGHLAIPQTAFSCTNEPAIKQPPALKGHFSSAPKLVTHSKFYCNIKWYSKNTVIHIDAGRRNIDISKQISFRSHHMQLYRCCLYVLHIYTQSQLGPAEYLKILSSRCARYHMKRTI